MFTDDEQKKEKAYKEILSQEKTDLKKQYGIYIDFLKKSDNEKLESIKTLMDPYNNLSLNEVQFLCQAVNNKLVTPEKRQFYYDVFFENIVHFFNNTTSEKAMRTSVELIPWSDDKNLETHIKKLDDIYKLLSDKHSRAKSKFLGLIEKLKLSLKVRNNGYSSFCVN